MPSCANAPSEATRTVARRRSQARAEACDAWPQHAPPIPANLVSHVGHESQSASRHPSSASRHTPPSDTRTRPRPPGTGTKPGFSSAHQATSDQRQATSTVLWKRQSRRSPPALTPRRIGSTHATRPVTTRRLCVASSGSRSSSAEGRRELHSAPEAIEIAGRVPDVSRETY